MSEVMAKRGRLWIRTAAALLMSFALSSVASAQDSAGRFHWGVLHLTPSIAISGVGVDDNVNQDADNPVSDRTAMFGPTIDVWMKTGPGKLSAKSAGAYQYFQQSAGERAWNTTHQVRLEMPINRFKPFVGAAYAQARARPDSEIDSRPHAASSSRTLGTELRVAGRTTLVFSGERATVAFDANQTFLGNDLATALNHDTDTEQIQLRCTWTPLTTFTVTSSATQDRFEGDQIRNGNGMQAEVGVELKPLALISGSARVGYRHVNASSDSTPDFRGLTTLAAVSYAMLPATTISASAARGVEFSVEALQPYYVSTGASVKVTQRLRTTWDVSASIGREVMGYQALTTAPEAGGRVDTVRQYGLGVGYRLGAVRLGFDGGVDRRSSQKSGRSYQAIRLGTSISYGGQ